jgi:hypothetical protein
MLMKALQLAIILIVGCWLIEIEATPNGLVVGLVSVGAAWLLTVPPLKLFDWARRKRPTSVVPYDESAD